LLIGYCPYLYVDGIGRKECPRCGKSPMYAEVFEYPPVTMNRRNYDAVFSLLIGCKSCHYVARVVVLQDATAKRRAGAIPLHEKYITVVVFRFKMKALSPITERALLHGGS
jgi:hypothetical protein